MPGKSAPLYSGPPILVWFEFYAHNGSFPTDINLKLHSISSQKRQKIENNKQKTENRNGVKYQILNIKYQIQSLKSVEYFKAGIIAQVVRRGVQTWSKIQIDPIFERFKYSKGSNIPIFQRSNNIPKL